ncbi:hypothetical protein [Bacillus sp. FSL R10-2780]|uniref:hypothetical protein n=1 Tax=Bacillus sp. FSL R10-2780 TaxID=2954660 RepID=UPI0030F6956F
MNFWNKSTCRCCPIPGTTAGLKKRIRNLEKQNEQQAIQIMQLDQRLRTVENRLNIP